VSAQQLSAQCWSSRSSGARPQRIPATARPTLAGAWQAAYPHPDVVTHGMLSDVYSINGKVGKLVIEISRADSGDVGYWPADEADTVLWMGAVQHSDPSPAIAGTDGGPSTCPTNA
jgi:hypothetical protein